MRVFQEVRNISFTVLDLLIRGGYKVNFRVLQNFTNKTENRNDINMQKNHRFSKKQEGMVLTTAGVQI